MEPGEAQRPTRSADAGESGPGTHVRARELTIDDGHAGQRIDNFLLGVLKGLPRERVYRSLRRGEVRVNGGRIRQHYRLQAGDVVRVPPLRLGGGGQGRPAPGRHASELLEQNILHESETLIVIDKPAGLAVHGGSGLSHGVIEALRAGRPKARFLELVHRLDRDTSGCLVVAKRRSSLLALHRALREGQVGKRYLALLVGRVRKARIAEGALLRNQTRSGERVVRVDASGKPARTRFLPLGAGAGATLCEATPETGRTHQIRVHAGAIGHPVAGDPKYGDRDANRQLREAGLRRLFLHASTISFTDPASGLQLEVHAPLPGDLLGVLDALHIASRTGKW